MNEKDKHVQDKKRMDILEQWNQWFDIPLAVLGGGWLALLIIELTQGLTPLLENLSFTIWMIFILDFVVRLSLAPFKLDYLKSNWLTVLSLIIPAFGLFRGLRFLAFFRVARGLRLAKIATAIRRGMLVLGRFLGRHGLGYIIALTCVITLLT